LYRFRRVAGLQWIDFNAPSVHHGVGLCRDIVSKGNFHARHKEPRQ
jgi:hypothetical protein